MKIGSKPPSLPSFPDVAVAPTPTGSVPIPYPNVGNGRVPDSFAPGSGVERRYSVQFLKGLEGRLQLAGLGNAFASELKRHMSTLDRSGVDREGRVVDALLTGAHPKESLHLYELTSKLTALVTPDGVRAEANRLGTWTIRPPEGDPVELAPGASLRLGQTTLEATHEQLQAKGSLTGKLHAHGAEVAKLLDPATMAVALGLPSVTPMSSGAAKTGAQLLDRALQTGLSAASFALDSELKQSLELTSELRKELGTLEHSVSSLLTVMMEYEKLSQAESRDDRKLGGQGGASLSANLENAAGALDEVRSAITQPSGASAGESVIRIITALKRMLNTVDVLGSRIAELGAGNLGKASAQLDKALGDTLPVVTKFLGDFVGLSGAGAKTGEAIHKTSQLVERMLGNALGTLLSAAKPVREQLTALLTQAGQSAAPSRKADPAAEKAVLLLELARRGPDLTSKTNEAEVAVKKNQSIAEKVEDVQARALEDLKQLADRIRGQPRDFVLGARFR